MADSNDIQGQINLVMADQAKWSAELMRLNGVLATAKGGVKTRTKRAIKNAEQFLDDLKRRLRNLDADLSKAMKVEVKQKDDILLAEKGISNGKGEMIKSIVEGATSITKSLVGGTQDDGLVSLTKKKDVSSDTTSTTMKPTTMYIIGGAILLVLLFMFKKK